MKNRLVFLCTLLLSAMLLCSAPLENVPITLTQPDGTEISCYASGDEFYHWFHDANGNVIVQDPVTGFYCYREKKTNKLSAVHKCKSASSQLTKYTEDDSLQRDKMMAMYELPESHPYKFAASASTKSANATGTTINNIVIFITFSGQSDYTPEWIESFTQRFTNFEEGAISLKRYYWESSYHQLTVNSTFYPTGSSVYSYKDNHPETYYCPASSTNPDGYDSGDMRRIREQTLLANAIKYVSNQIPSSLNVDTDNDGKVDNVTFIVKGGGTAGWAELLWPHRWSLTEHNVIINGKKVYNYNLLSYVFSNVATLCHEFGHTLGMPDLYHYGNDTITGRKYYPVGSWDLMATTGNVQMSGYMKNKYLHWITNIPTITQSGTYTLSPISSSSQCYKIPISGSNEYLYLEYRKETETYDTSIPNSGLLIYRINPSKNGNAGATECGGVNDEVYVYRPGGSLTSEGTLSTAPFCAGSHNSFYEDTDPQEFLSNGNLGNIYISNVSSCASSISFHVDICPTNDVIYYQNSTIPANTNARTITTSGNVVLNGDKVFNAVKSVTLKAGFKVPEGKSFEANVMLHD